MNRRRRREPERERDGDATLEDAKRGPSFMLSASKQRAAIIPPSSADGTDTRDVGAIVATPAAPATASDRQGKKRGRTCKMDGCDNYIVYKGLCCRHGGGKKCSVDGCDTSAKHQGLCWKHGGSVECKMDNCTKKAKAKGLCWAHGGGTKCSHDGCSKVAVSNSSCWAHGGGKRCIYDGCQKPAYERTHNFCVKHYHELQHVDYFEV